MKKFITRTVIGLMAIALPAFAAGGYNDGNLPVGSNISGHLLPTSASNLGFFSATTSAQLRGVISDETGTGALVFAGGALGTPASLTLTNATGLPLAGMTSNTANTLLGYNGSGAAADVTIGSGLTLSGGSLSGTGGTVTTASVASANGFSGTVANPTTTPALTLSTTASGILKGSAGSLVAATSGTDYAPATTGSSILKASAGGFANAVSGTDYAPATSGAAILYGNGAGGFSNVTVGTGLAFSAGSLTATASAPAFNTILSGTNTNALLVGTGGALGASGSGTITATAVPASGITGTLGASSGGTGQTSVSSAFTSFYESVATTLGDIVYGAASGAPTRLGGNTSATTALLTQTGNGTVSAAPAWTLPSAMTPAFNGSAITALNATNLSSGTVAAARLPAATTSTLGVVSTDGATITNASGAIACATGTTSQLGCLKPDGTVITVTAGLITVPTATSSVLGVVKPDGTIITNTAGAITVAKGTTGAFGVVETDGSTITNASSVISCTTATSSQIGCSKPDGTILTVSAGTETVANASSTGFGVAEVDNTTITASGGVISSVVGPATTNTLTNKSIAGSEINSGVVGATYGGTGANNSASTGVAQWSSGTYSVSSGLTNGTTATTQAVGDNTTKLATDSFVQNQINAQVDMHDPVQAATTAALLFTPTYSNGSSGIGATLTGTAGVLLIDGYTPVLNDRLLVKNQASSFQNGCYTITTLGTISVGYVLTRCTDFNQTANLNYGDTFPVLQGSTNVNQQFTMNNNTSITVGTTAVTFAQTSGGSQLVAGTGISITGNTVALATPVSLANGGTNATSALAALVSLGVEDSANESYLTPHDTTANRPATPSAGMLRLNTTTFNPEMYANGTWEQFNTAPIGNNGVLYNPTGNTLPHLRTALANVVSNTSNAKILWIGTSTVSGYNSGGSGVWNQSYTEEYLLAQNLTNSYGINANNDSIFGYPSAGGTDQRTTDSRLSVGSGWGSDSVWSIGGQMFSNNSTTNNLSFTMPTTADTVVLYYVLDNAIPLGTFTWQVNSGSTTSINEGASSPALASVTISLTPGANTLKIARVSGTVKIVGYEAYLSTKKTLDVINSGTGGVVAGSFTSNGGGKPYGLPTVLATFAPDAIFVQMDNNDAISGTATATYKTNITSLLTGGSASTDPLLIAQEPCGSGGGCSSGTLPPYITAQQQVAAASSLAFVNQTARITSYDNVLTPLGYSNADGLHADTAGYIDEGDFLTKQLATVAGIAPLPNQDINPALADAAANRTYTGANTFSGTTTQSGSETASGAFTFTNSNSHSGTETFTGNIKIPTTAGCPAYAATVTLTSTSPYWQGVNTSTGAVTVNLPVGAQGIAFLIQDCTGNAATHNITVTPNGSNNINGVNSSITITTSYGASALISPSSTTWFAN